MPVDDRAAVEGDEESERSKQRQEEHEQRCGDDNVKAALRQRVEKRKGMRSRATLQVSTNDHDFALRRRGLRSGR